MDDDRARVSDRLRRIRDRHFDCYVDLARAAQESGADEPEWLEVLDSELANLRSALEWGLATGRYETAAFATSLLSYWHKRRRFAEGRQIVDRALRHPDLAPSDRIDALLAAGALASDDGVRDIARERYEAARRLATSAGDLRRKALAARRLGWCLYFLLLPRPAEEAFDEALELSHLVAPSERADTLRGLGWVRALQGDFQGALDLQRQAGQVLEVIGDPSLPYQYGVEVNLLVGMGRLDDALVLADKSLSLARGGTGDLILALSAKAQVAEGLGHRNLLLGVVDEGISVTRAAGDSGWEARFQYQLVGAALDCGDIDSGRQAIDRALSLLDAMDAMSIDDKSIQARLLAKRAGLAEDDGELDIAEELLRRASADYSGWNPTYQAAGLAELARLLDRHGDADGARLAMNQAIALTEKGRRISALHHRSVLAEVDGHLEAALQYTTEALAESKVNYSGDFPAAARRRAALLAELGSLDEAAAAASEALESEAESRDSLGRARSHLGRARVRIADDDPDRARQDLRESTRLAEVASADDQLDLAVTHAHLALLDGRGDRAVALWSAVRDYRAATTRVAPRLSRRFEAPLVELETGPVQPAVTARAALDALRSLVTEEFAALTVGPEDPPDGSGTSP